MRNYLGIMMSPPKESDEWSFKNFSNGFKNVMMTHSQFNDIGIYNINPIGFCIALNLDDPSKKYSKNKVIFILTDKRLIGLMKVGRDAAHLYDAVMLYAWSIRKILEENLGDPNNGTLVIDNLKRRPYFRYKVLNHLIS